MVIFVEGCFELGLGVGYWRFEYDVVGIIFDFGVIWVVWFIELVYLICVLLDVEFVDFDG